MNLFKGNDGGKFVTKDKFDSITHKLNILETNINNIAKEGINFLINGQLGPINNNINGIISRLKKVETNVDALMEFNKPDLPDEGGRRKSRKNRRKSKKSRKHRRKSKRHSRR